MNRRILGIVAGLLLPPIGIIVFSIGAEQSLNATFRFGSQAAEPSFGGLLLLLGGLIVAAGVAAGYWSGTGVAIAGGIGVLIGFVQLVFPIAMGTFNFASWLISLVGAALPQDASRALLTFVYLGGPITVGALLLGAGIGLAVRRRSAGSGTLWQVIGVAAAIIGIPVALVGQGFLVTSLRIGRVDPLSTVVLVLAAVLLATAAYSSRGGGLALVISGAVVAALGLVVVLVPSMTAGPSAIVRLSQENAYLFSQGMPVLFGVILLAVGLVSLLLKPRTTDAVPATAV